MMSKTDEMKEDETRDEISERETPRQLRAGRDASRGTMGLG